MIAALSGPALYEWGIRRGCSLDRNWMAVAEHRGIHSLLVEVCPGYVHGAQKFYDWFGRSVSFPESHCLCLYNEFPMQIQAQLCIQHFGLRGAFSRPSFCRPTHWWWHSETASSAVVLPVPRSGQFFLVASQGPLSLPLWAKLSPKLGYGEALKKGRSLVSLEFVLKSLPSS